MKIAVADNNSRKFTDDIINHWESLGHEVHYEQGASEYLAQWADIYYIDTWDNNIHYLYKLYHEDQDHNRTKDWDNNKKPKIIVRLLDWEVWIGFARDQAMIDWIDGAVCIAPHIEKELRSKNNWGEKLKYIRPGINLDKFPLKKAAHDNFQMGMVLCDMWKYKNHMGGLDIFTTLFEKDNRWRLHIRGQHESGIYDPENWNYYLESRGIKDVITLYPVMADMNEFYEKIDFLLHPGQKEAFCYAVGEAMAKGIPTVVNDFLGSHDIWPIWSLYKTHEEAIKKIEYIRVRDDFWKGGNPKIREYIEKTYPLEKMLKEIDAFIGI